MKNSFLSKIKYAKKYLLGNEFYNEHFDAAIEILDIMASKKPHTNHIILDAPTQVGKTSVMEMVYRILNFEETYNVYGIKQVLYMTSDNGSGEGSLKLQTTNRFKSHWKNYVHSLPIDFLKRSDFDKFTHVMDNTIIMVDESQYGWREIFNKGQRLLQINGINFCSTEELAKRNTYIISVSATTQNERFGDSPLKLKPIVKLKPGKGYIGFNDFFNENIVRPVTKDEFIDNYEKLDEFLAKQCKKLNTIYKNTGVAKCVILRLVDNKRKNFLTDSDEFENIADKNGFVYKLVSCKDSKIDYVSLQSNIFYNCNNYEENGKKFFLMVIKYAFSYGITIEPKIKKLIATCYDVRKDLKTTEATEQGLMGRMSGYGCSIEDFENLEIYVNETHYNGIKGNVVYNNNEYSVPTKKIIKQAQIKCQKKEWDGEKSNIVAWRIDNLVFKGKVVDDYFKKHPEYDYEHLFSPDSNSNKKSFMREIMTNFIVENNIDKKCCFDLKNIIELRRKYRKNDYYADWLCSSDPIISSESRPSWRTVENADKNKNAFGMLIDVTEANPISRKGVVIKIAYGTIGFAKVAEVEKLKENRMKKWSGYDTSSNNYIIAPKTIV